MGCCFGRFRPTEPELRWARLVRRIIAIRKLQRLFAYVGQYLQGFPRNLLDRLSRTHPKEQ